jgi:hypothetical protein
VSEEMINGLEVQGLRCQKLKVRCYFFPALLIEKLGDKDFDMQENR